jgi:hypothetical protein
MRAVAAFRSSGATMAGSRGSRKVTVAVSGRPTSGRPHHLDAQGKISHVLWKRNVMAWLSRNPRGIR